MDTEVLLTWMSETGSGDIASLRDRVSWLARSHNYTGFRHLAGRWLRDISALGHAEIDWASGRWAIAPATAVLLPECGGTVVLAGSRRSGLLRELGESFDAFSIDRPFSSDDSIPPPPSVFIRTESIQSLSAGLARQGVCYVGQAAYHIAARLPQIRLGNKTFAPTRDNPAERLADGTEYGTFVEGRPDGNGLCRFTINGRPDYFYQQDGDWYHTDHSTGILLEMAERGTSVMRWREERVSNGSALGTLFVDQGAPLPPLQTRALVLCSGEPPTFFSTAKTVKYQNVPSALADRVAKSVRQTVIPAD